MGNDLGTDDTNSSDGSETSDDVSDVDDPWADEIDIQDASPAFFAPRTTSLSVYDGTGDVEALAEGARRHYGFDDTGPMLDRAVRLYLAHLLTRDDLSHLRDGFDAYGVIPPRGWIESFERERIEPVAVNTDGGPMPIKTVGVVKELVTEVVSKSGYDSQSDFAIAALKWLTNQDE